MYCLSATVESVFPERYIMHNIHEESLGYWSGRAKEYSALHMDEYHSGKSHCFAQIIRHYLECLEQPSRYVTADQQTHLNDDKDNTQSHTQPNDSKQTDTQKHMQPIRALDVGCGSGFLSMILAKEGCTVTSVDFSEDMLEQARQNLHAEGLGNCTFAHMPAQDLRFDDASFDIAVTRNVLWTLEDADLVYAQMMRVLRPGGVLVNMDAAYGQAFVQADARGEIPHHRTQTLDQLRTRNHIAHNLTITQVDRPQWDITQLWDLGAAKVECYRNIGDFCGQQTMKQDASMFVVAARK